MSHVFAKGLVDRHAIDIVWFRAVGQTGWLALIPFLGLPCGSSGLALRVRASLRKRAETRAVSIRTVALGQAGVDGVSHFVVCQQFFERVAVEQRGALVTEFWDFDFDAINLFGTIEDASDAQKLVVAALNNLVTQRFDDPHFASHSECGRVQQAVTRTRVSASAFVKAR